MSLGLYYNGNWQQGNGPLFESYNPANGDTAWEGASASREDIEIAVQSAQDAAYTWSVLPLKERIHYLNAFHDSIKRNSENLAHAISFETGKPLWEARSEVDAVAAKVPISIEAIGLRCGERIEQKAAGVRSIARHQPHGIVAVFGPFNFPAHLPNGHIVPALLAGNTVIFKPSELTPLVAEHLLHCWDEAGLPDGVLSLMQGGHHVSAHLASHPAINGIFFTGSAKTGLMLSEMFATQPNRILALEMGGNNPLIVSEVKDVKAAAYLTIQSSFITSGQRCTCARRLIVLTGAAGDHFLDTLATLTSQIVIGAYQDIPEPFMGPVITSTTAKHLLNVQSRFLQQGACAIVKMKSLERLGPAFVSPGILDVTAVKDRPDEEIFGPLLQIIRVASFDEAIEEANRTRFGLAAGLLSDDPEEYQLFRQSIRAGVVNWNTALTGASSSQPFGGIGFSGNFRPSAFYAADYCAYPVASMESSQLVMPVKLSPGLGER